MRLSVLSLNTIMQRKKKNKNMRIRRGPHGLLVTSVKAAFISDAAAVTRFG
jgi:hypothetical protein